MTKTITGMKIGRRITIKIVFLKGNSKNAKAYPVNVDNKAVKMIVPIET